MLLWLLACDRAESPDCEGVGFASHAEATVDGCVGCHSELSTGEERHGAPEGVDFDDGTLATWAPLMAFFATQGHGRPVDAGAFARWAACGSPDAPPPPCTGETVEGDVVLSEVPELCADSRYVVGTVTVDADGAECLCGVDGDLIVQTSVGVPRLRRVRGEIRIEGGSGFTANRLVETEGLRAEGVTGLARVELAALEAAGPVRVRDNPDLTRLDVSRLARVEGPVLITDNPALPAVDLAALTEVSGPVDVSGNTMLADLVTPNGLTALPDALEISEQGLLTEVTGFAGLTEVEGAVRLVGLRAERIEGFEGLRTAGSVQLVNLGSPLRLVVFPELREVTGTLRVSDLGPVGTVQMFASLERVSGALLLEEFAGQAAFGLGALDAVEGGIEIKDNPDLVDLGAFANLARTASLAVHGNALLPDLQGFEGLSELEGALEIHDNPAMTSLAGLSGIEQVGALRIEDLPLLTDLSALDALGRVDGPLLVRNVGSFTPAELEALFADVEVGGTRTFE